MKKQLKTIVVILLACVLLFSFGGCSQKTFNEACNGLKQEILNDGEYTCEFSTQSVYGRTVFAIDVYVYYGNTSNPAAMAKLLFAYFKSDYIDYIEQNFSQFTQESIFVEVHLNNTVYDDAYGYIYGYYA